MLHIPYDLIALILRAILAADIVGGLLFYVIINWIDEEENE